METQGNPQWPQDDPASWNFEFGRRTAETVGETIAQAVGGLSVEGVDLPAFTQEMTSVISDHLTTTLQAVSSATAGLQRRTNLLWWKESLFSPSARLSYRDMTSSDAATLMAFDMHQQIPTFSPASVAAFLRETVVALPTLDREETASIRELVGEDPRCRHPFPAPNGSRKPRQRPGGALLRSRDDRSPKRHASTRRPRVPRSHRRQARHGTHLARLVGLDIPGASGRSRRCRSLHAETADLQEADTQEVDTMPECPQETCFWSDGAGCGLGFLDPSLCPALKAAPTEKQDDQPSPEAVAMPWSGSALGLTDLGFVAGRSKPIVLAVMGPHNAGKTTLLGACYLLLGHGHRPNDKLRFSGSCSLAGWENVASPLRWKPGSLPPAFPPHTSSTTVRIPGLLHLAFKHDGDHRTDYVITDAPGEWFRKSTFMRWERPSRSVQDGRPKQVRGFARAEPARSGLDRDFSGRWKPCPSSG